MKKTYILSFFLCLSVLGLAYFGSYYFINKYMAEPMYENLNKLSDSNQENPIEIIGEIPKESEKQSEKGEELLAVDTNKEELIHRDTTYILESYNTKNFELKEERVPLPREYIGLSRKELVAKLDIEKKEPKEYLNDRVLKDIQLISYSPDEIIIRKSYEPKDTEESFYLMVENNMVNVYYSDRKTVYMYTDIVLDTLPEEIQNEIIGAKYIRSPMELYNFLESYSS